MRDGPLLSNKAHKIIEEVTDSTIQARLWCSRRAVVPPSLPPHVCHMHSRHTARMHGPVLQPNVINCRAADVSSTLFCRLSSWWHQPLQPSLPAFKGEVKNEGAASIHWEQAASLLQHSQVTQQSQGVLYKHNRQVSIVCDHDKPMEGRTIGPPLHWNIEMRWRPFPDACSAHHIPETLSLSAGNVSLMEGAPLTLLTHDVDGC